jgi:hypothetical protein
MGKIFTTGEGMCIQLVAQEKALEIRRVYFGARSRLWLWMG